MCTQCAFNLLERMELFVEAQEGRDGVIDLMTSLQVTNHWINELRSVLHNAQLFVPHTDQKVM